MNKKTILSIAVGAALLIVIVFSMKGARLSAAEYHKQAYEARMKARRGHCEMTGAKTASCYKGSEDACIDLRSSVAWFTHEYGETPEFACQQEDRPFGSGETQFDTMAQSRLISGSLDRDEDIQVDTVYWEITHSLTAVTIFAPVVTATGSVKAPTVTRGTARTPSTLTLSSSLLTPQVTAGVAVLPEVMLLRLFLRGGGVRTRPSITPWWEAFERKKPPELSPETEFERFLRDSGNASRI